MRPSFRGTSVKNSLKGYCCQQAIGAANSANQAKVESREKGVNEITEEKLVSYFILYIFYKSNICEALRAKIISSIRGFRHID